MSELTEVPVNPQSAVTISTLRNQMAEAESRLQEARENVNGAALEVEKIELILSRWRRYEKYQQQRVSAWEHRILGLRHELRMEEDYASGIEG